MIKLTGNPGESTSKKMISSTGGTISFGKAHYIAYLTYRLSIISWKHNTGTNFSKRTSTYTGDGMENRSSWDQI